RDVHVLAARARDCLEQVLVGEHAHEPDAGRQDERQRHIGPVKRDESVREVDERVHDRNRRQRDTRRGRDAELSHKARRLPREEASRGRNVRDGCGIAHLSPPVAWNVPAQPTNSVGRLQARIPDYAETAGFQSQEGPTSSRSPRVALARAATAVATAQRSSSSVAPSVSSPRQARANASIWAWYASGKR